MSISTVSSESNRMPSVTSPVAKSTTARRWIPKPKATALSARDATAKGPVLWPIVQRRSPCAFLSWRDFEDVAPGAFGGGGGGGGEGGVGATTGGARVARGRATTPP